MTAAPFNDEAFEGLGLESFLESRLESRGGGCNCDPFLLASFVTNGLVEERRCWDLTPYQGPNIGPPFRPFDRTTPCAVWRLIEISDCYTHDTGRVDIYGRLHLLPEQFCSEFIYDGFMELQIGCFVPVSDPHLIEIGEEYQVNWPYDENVPEPCSPITPGSDFYTPP